MQFIAKGKNITVKYGPTVALKDISFELSAQDYIGLAGPNGAGKTSFVKMLLGLIPIQKGELTLFGKEIKDFRQWNRIGYLPQNYTSYNRLFPATVEEIVGLGLLSQKSWPKHFEKKDKQRINDALEKLMITDFKKRYIGDLSGGEQQRVFLARCLVSEPELLILDEPSTALDPSVRETFFTMLHQIYEEKKITIILITHDTAQIGHYARTLLYLDKEIIFFGPFNEFCKSKSMQTYFGDASQHLICHQHDQ